MEIAAMRLSCIVAIVLAIGISGVFGQDLQQEPNTWVKRSPLPQAPLSPMLGYEGSFGYDPIAKRLIRWAGHNQGGRNLDLRSRHRSLGTERAELFPSGRLLCPAKRLRSGRWAFPPFQGLQRQPWLAVVPRDLFQ
jgi:hypothetical protein